MIDIFTLVSKTRMDLIKENNTHYSQSLHTRKQYIDYQAREAAKEHNTKGTND